MDDSIPHLEVYHLISPRWTGVRVVVVLAGLILPQAVIVFGGLVLRLTLSLSWLEPTRESLSSHHRNGRGEADVGEG